MILFVPISLALCAGGLLILLASVSFPFIAPLGVISLWSSAYPYARWLSRKIKADIAYANRDHPLVEDPEWAEEEVDEILLAIIVNQNGRAHG
jgi:hypothetical protein